MFDNGAQTLILKRALHDKESNNIKEETITDIVKTSMDLKFPGNTENSIDKNCIKK